MKKSIVLLMCLVLLAGLMSGCSSTAPAAAPSASSPAASPSATVPASPSEAPPATASAPVDYSQLKIGLLLSGSAKDGGWSQMAADAATTVKDKYGCTVNFSESTPATDYESTMRGYADAGYNIIVSHGAEFLDAAKLVSPSYPDITFICTSAESGQEPNLTGIDFATYQLGFLNGAACAMTTETKKIGAVASNQISSLVAWAKGVEEGAKYIDPACEVITVYTGSYDDPLKAKQAVDALQQKGCDTITQNADACGAGAVQESDALGLMNVGAVSDQTTLGENCFISIMQDAKLGIEVAIDKAVQGALEPGFVSMGAAEGVITLSVYSGKFADVLTADEKAVLQDLWQKSYDGMNLADLIK